jgi:transcription initiation factor IIE alpha subunit
VVKKIKNNKKVIRVAAKKSAAPQRSVYARVSVSVNKIKKAGDLTGKKREIRVKMVKPVISAVSPEVMKATAVALEDMLFLDYIAKNIGSQANDVLRELSKSPRKDEQLAETMGIKLNEVRRVLNLLNKHGIVRYDVKKDSSGWLTFEWHVDFVAFSDFYKGLNQKSEVVSSALPSDCNDFFVCVVCNKKQGILYPFDVAYEKRFKCDCGKNLNALTRVEAEIYIKN